MVGFEPTVGQYNNQHLAPELVLDLFSLFK